MTNPNETPAPNKCWVYQVKFEINAGGVKSSTYYTHCMAVIDLKSKPWPYEFSITFSKIISSSI